MLSDATTIYPVGCLTLHATRPFLKYNAIPWYLGNSQEPTTKQKVSIPLFALTQALMVKPSFHNSKFPKHWLV